jgi:hypothetical protein
MNHQLGRCFSASLRRPLARPAPLDSGHRQNLVRGAAGHHREEGLQPQPRGLSRTASANALFAWSQDQHAYLNQVFWPVHDDASTWRSLALFYIAARRWRTFGRSWNPSSPGSLSHRLERRCRLFLKCPSSSLRPLPTWRAWRPCPPAIAALPTLLP